ECMGNEKVHDLIDLRKIEVAPLAYMRGRTLNDSFVILDEAQNCTLAQLKMFMTRLGRNARMCIGGDITQIDLPPGKSGLAASARILDQVQDIGVVEFGSEDIIRHPLVERIVRAFEKHDASQGPATGNENVQMR
ncbi:MAG: PhoH family protein, partial [Leptospiraceae bacterium]|nr:PhoH family protein [Leptospiraceae bacterium]